MSKRKRSGEVCFKFRVKTVTDSLMVKNGGDDSVDPTCVGWWECERPRCGGHGKNDGVYSQGRVLHVEKNGL